MREGYIYFLLIMLAYFFPAITAFKRRHPQRAAITLTNLFLGWTGFGWVVALIWSATVINNRSNAE